MKFEQVLKNEVLLFDGAMGTQLQERGLKYDTPEELNLSHPDDVYAVYKSYVDAGSHAIETNTLGANPIKLARFGLADKTIEINQKSVELAKKAADGKALIALSIGSSGELIKPFGPLDFDDVAQSYKTQAEGGKEADVLYFETLTDMSEARIGLIAAREITDMPEVLSFTFEANGKTVMGNPPECCAIFADRMKISALGINCSGGPEQLLPILKLMRGYCSLPVIVQPNAGLPELVDGHSHFPFGAEIMCEKMKPIVEAGASSIGGCCGTTPEHIKLLKELVDGRKPPEVTNDVPEYICSRRSFVLLSEAIEKSYEYKPAPTASPYDLMDISFSLGDEVSVTLDLTDLDEDKIKELMLEGQDMPSKPLIFKIITLKQAESALRYYHGIAAISAPEGTDIAKVAKQYGAYIV